MIKNLRLFCCSSTSSEEEECEILCAEQLEQTTNQTDVITQQSVVTQKNMSESCLTSPGTSSQQILTKTTQQEGPGDEVDAKPIRPKPGYNLLGSDYHEEHEHHGHGHKQGHKQGHDKKSGPAKTQEFFRDLFGLKAKEENQHRRRGRKDQTLEQQEKALGIQGFGYKMLE